MNAYVFAATDEHETQRLGAALAACLPARATVALCGTLGAGKTRLVQAIAVADGVNRDNITSPTFVICQHYYGAHTIHHLDAYRIKDEDEWFELGVDELFEQDGWAFVEWADRFEAQLPDAYLRIDIEVSGTTERIFRWRAMADELESVAAAIAAQLPTK